MPNRHLTDALREYLQTPLTDYAVLINGAWGTGKTHFLNNALPRSISDLGWTVNYLSLHGVRSSDEMAGMLYAKAFPQKLEELTGFSLPDRLAEQSSRVGVTALLDKLATPGLLASAARGSLAGRKIVYCFDDLERARDVESVIAFVSSLLEDRGTKIVLVGAEAEIDSASQGTYARRKEKIVGYTLQFSSDTSQAITETIAALPDIPGLRSLLADNALAIVEASCNIAEINLRSVIHALRLFSRIYQTLSAANVPLDRIGVPMLRLTLGIVLEVKRDESRKAVLRRICEPSFSEMAIHMRTGHEKANRDDIYVRDFLARYAGRNATSAPTYAPIYQYVFDGYLGVSELVEHARRHIAALEGGPPAPETAFLHDFRSLTDEQFAQQAETSLRQLGARQVVRVDRLYQLATRLFYFGSEGLLPISADDVIALFEQVILDLRNAGKLVPLDSRDLMSNLASSYGEPDDPRFKKVVSLLLEANSHRARAKEQESVEKIFRLAEADPDKFLSEVQDNFVTRHRTTPRFQYCDPGRLASALERFSNEQLTQLTGILHARYGYAKNLGDYFAVETDALASLAQALTTAANSRSMGGPYRIARLAFRGLASDIGRIVAELRKNT